MLAAGGDQIISTRPTAAHVRFGTAARDAVEKVFLSVEHEKSGFGKCDPAYLLSKISVYSHKGQYTEIKMWNIERN